MDYIKPILELLAKTLNTPYPQLKQKIYNAMVVEFYWDKFENKPYAHIYDIYKFDIDRIEEAVRQYIDFPMFIEGMSISTSKPDKYRDIIELLELSDKEVLFVIDVRGKECGLMFIVYVDK